MSQYIFHTRTSEAYLKTLRGRSKCDDQRSSPSVRTYAPTERLVSLYLTLISAAVSRIASIASSNVTLYTFWLAIASCAAVIALTAAPKLSVRASPQRPSESRRPLHAPPRLFRSYQAEETFSQRSATPKINSRTIQGTWTRPSMGSHVNPKLCSAKRRPTMAQHINVNGTIHRRYYSLVERYPDLCLSRPLAKLSPAMLSVRVSV